jgi:hypothetical protein
MTQTMEVASNNVVYGNPNYYDFKLLRETNYLDSILSESEDLSPYPNDSTETRLELQEVIQAINLIKDDEELLQRYFLYDNSLGEYILNTLSIEIPNEEQNIIDTINSIDADITPLLLKIKYKHQRPRPYQLGLHFKLSLYPLPTVYAQSPSFPSGHTFQSKVICEVLGNKYPQFYNQLQILAEDISNSRLYLGVHYKSDLLGGVELANRVLSNKEFVKKYGL